MVFDENKVRKALRIQVRKDRIREEVKQLAGMLASALERANYPNRPGDRVSMEIGTRPDYLGRPAPVRFICGNGIWGIFHLTPHSNPRRLGIEELPFGNVKALRAMMPTIISDFIERFPELELVMEGFLEE